MLACARIGAVHSVVFAGLSDKALQQRLIDSEAKVVVTANWTLRRLLRAQETGEEVGDLTTLED